MQYTSAILLAAAGLATTVHGHGFVTVPTPRMPGSAMEAACGTQVYDNQIADNYGNIQGELQIAANQADYNAAECDIWLCKGYKYDDNTANVYSYTAGEVIDFTVDIRAPHTGTANVSIVDTATNTMISSTLQYWDVYASTATTIPANNTAFSITLPDVSDQCSTAGACVIQWYWYAESIDQTYESCIDFTMGGSGSNSTSAATSSAAATSAAATSVAASSAAASSAVATSAAASSAAASSAVATSAAISTVESVAPVSSAAATSVAAVSSVAASSSAAPTTLVTLTSSSAPSVVASSSSAAATSAKACKRKRSQRAAL